MAEMPDITDWCSGSWWRIALLNVLFVAALVGAVLLVCWGTVAFVQVVIGLESPEAAKVSILVWAVAWIGVKAGIWMMR